MEIEVYRNTSGKHFKEYIIEWDTHDMTVTTKWGRIGAVKQTKTVKFHTVTGLRQYVEQIISAREDHGYHLHDQRVFNTIPRTPAVPKDFLEDLEEMRAAERVG